MGDVGSSRISRRKAIGAIGLLTACGPVPSLAYGQVEGLQVVENPCERKGFHRCEITHVRGFNLVECIVQLPLGIYATKQIIELRCMSLAVERVAVQKGKQDRRALEEAFENGLLDAVRGGGWNWFYLRSAADNWTRSARYRWIGELWGSRVYGYAVRLADVLANKIVKDKPVPELTP